MGGLIFLGLGMSGHIFLVQDMGRHFSMDDEFSGGAQILLGLGIGEQMFLGLGMSVNIFIVLGIGWLII